MENRYVFGYGMGFPMLISHVRYLTRILMDLMDDINVRIGPIYFNDSSLLTCLPDGPAGEAKLERYHQ